MRVQVYREVGEIVQRPRRQEVVHERQRRLQAARERRVVGRADQRIEPDQTMAGTLQTRDLGRSAPADRRDPTRPKSAGPRARRAARGAPTAGAAPVARGRCASLPTTRASIARRPRSPRSGRAIRSWRVIRVRSVENRNVSTRAVPARRGVREVQEHARIALHRAADVAEQHQRARPHLAAAPRQADDVAAGVEAVGDRPPQIDARAVTRNPAPRATLSRSPLETIEHEFRLRDLRRT